jgi:hypothetical protein
MKAWRIARVTFERADGRQEILPEPFEGAVGWMACHAKPDEVRAVLERELAVVHLRLLSVEGEEALPDAESLADLDEHLAQNFVERREGAASVWGTIHVYLGSGEA